MVAFTWELSWGGITKVASHRPGPVSTWLPVLLPSNLSFLVAWWLDPKSEDFKRTHLSVQALIKPFLVSGLLMTPCPRQVTQSGPNSTWEGPTPGYSRREARCFGGHYNNDLTQYMQLDNILLGNYACSWDFPGGPVVGTLSFHCRGSWIQFLVGELRYCIRLRKEKKERKTVHVLKKKYHLTYWYLTHIGMYICLYVCIPVDLSLEDNLKNY